MCDVPSQVGRRAIVTGANSGTGREAATRLAAAGASVILAVRTPRKGQGARKEILHHVPGADVEAGVMNPPSREVTRDGFELQFGSNFLGPFLLTNLLLPRLLEAESPRVATMTSSAANGGRPIC